MPSHNLRTHLLLGDLVAGLERELDGTTAALSEVYPTCPLRPLRLSKQRVRTNLFAASLSNKLPFVPRYAALRSDDDLFRLVISDLYGNQSSVAGRELMQNAVDACRERNRLEDAHGRVEDPKEFRALQEDVEIVIEYRGERDWALVVSDRGCGMDADVIIDYFLKAGASFGPTSEDFDRLPRDAALRYFRAGRFGIGAFAAFLLGSCVDVETRALGAPEGLRFVARIDGDVVELTRAILPFGTRVAIPFSLHHLPSTLGSRAHSDVVRLMLGDAAEQVSDEWLSDAGQIRELLTSIAGCYRLQEPRVAFGVKYRGKVQYLRWQPDVPQPGRKLPDTWRAFHSDGFDALMWAIPARERLGSDPEVIHNGITIRHPDADGRVMKRDVYRWSDEGLNDLVRRPKVAVFDTRQQLGVALHRYELKSPNLPFEDALLTSMGTELVALALAAGPLNGANVSVGWGTRAVLSREYWFPLLPTLLDRYGGVDVCVLWIPEVSASRYLYRPVFQEYAERHPFLARRSAVAWRSLRTRIELEYEVADEVRYEPEFPMRYLQRATDLFSERFGRTQVAAVTVGVDEAPDADPHQWRIEKTAKHGKSSSHVALVKMDPGDELVQERLFAAAISLATTGELRGPVSLAVFRKSTSKPRFGDQAIARSWLDLVDGWLPRSSRRLLARRDEIARRSRAIRAALTKWDRLLDPARYGDTFGGVPSGQPWMW